MPYRSIEDPARLRRVLEATLQIEADLDLSVLLRHIIEEARSMAGARYGAIGVLNDDRTALTEFLTVGLEPDQEERIGPRPTGQGVLGILITDPHPVRLADIGSHPDSFGFPAHHPAMTSFLGVPIKVRDEVYGNLYLTDKIGWSEFTGDDEALVEALALGAGIAIENARLHQRVQRAAVYEDRDRVARDLHDNVIQRLFAAGLSLQSMAAAATTAGIADRLQTVVADLDETIRQVRSTIYELGSAEIRRGVRDSVVTLVRELDPVVGFGVRVTFDGAVDTLVSDQLAEHLLAVVREAVTNIGRHAQATEASVSLSVAHGQCRLQVSDNGRGIGGADMRQGGLGLGNLRRRAEKLHGQFTADSPDTGGTSLVWEVPVH
ncbi:MAG TPA: GAF domain-containing sensor histidine kinase [Acidimicrobiales bacterium]|nr:GAF domain-containing sensor histidine kinase [Acidimicrobiales bacterium]